MSDDDGTTTPMEPHVGVVAPESPTAITAVIEAAGGTARVDTAASVVAAKPDVIVAVGDGAIGALARAGATAPVLAVGVEAVASVAESSSTAALEALVAGEFRTRPRPILGIRTPDHDARALADATLVSATPATISEFSVTLALDGPDCEPNARSADRHSGWRASTTGERTARFRADGVVVATPAGSEGYARSAGGPRLTPDTGVVSVVPIAPFALDPGHWVCRPSALSITVERDEAPVELRADDRSVGPIEPGVSVTFEVVGSIAIVRSSP